MPVWLRDSIAFLQSAPLVAFWYLFGSFFIGCYLMALLLVHAIPAQTTTVIYRARRAWAIAVLIHGAAAVVVLLNWYFSHRMLTTFTHFIPFYVVLLLLDLILGIGLLLSARRFQRYGQ